ERHPITFRPVVSRMPSMRTIRNSMFFATHVANFLACRHITTLDRAETAGEITKPFFNDPGIDLLRKLGLDHERTYLRHLAEREDSKIVEIATDSPWAEAVAAT